MNAYQQAQAIYDILAEECGASDRHRDDFVGYYTRQAHQGFVGPSSVEYRFMGNLGSGGKFHRQHDRVWVSCYKEDDTPERVEAVARATERIKALIGGQREVVS